MSEVEIFLSGVIFTVFIVTVFGSLFFFVKKRRILVILVNLALLVPSVLFFCALGIMAGLILPFTAMSDDSYIWEAF